MGPAHSGYRRGLDRPPLDCDGVVDFQGTACSLGSASPAEQAFEGHVTAYSTVVLVTTLLCSATDWHSRAANR